MFVSDIKHWSLTYNIKRETVYFFFAVFFAGLSAVAGAFFFAAFFAVVFFAGVFFSAFSFLAGAISFLLQNLGLGPLAIISRQSAFVKSEASLPPFGIL